jgi:hypothetical protein
MAILKNVSQKVKDMFKVLAGSAVVVGISDTLKGILADKGIQAGSEFIKSLATGKGLENEAVYGFILDQCKLKTEERNSLIRSIEELRHGSEKEKQAANNFIIIVALDPNKSGKRPGEQIIHGFIHRISEYATEAEKVQMIKDNIIHIGTDAEVKKKVAIVQKWAMEAWQQIKGLVEQFNNLSDTYKNCAEKELGEYEARPWWKKLLLN